MAQRLVDTNKQRSATNTSQKKVCQQMFYNTISAENSFLFNTVTEMLEFLCVFIACAHSFSC